MIYPTHIHINIILIENIKLLPINAYAVLHTQTKPTEILNSLFQINDYVSMATLSSGI